MLVQKRLEGDVVALEARIVRQSSEATPKGGPEYWVQREKTTGLACSVQMGQYDEDEKFLQKINTATHHLSAGVRLFSEYQSRHPAVKWLILKETWL